jgi:hypothetical protein
MHERNPEVPPQERRMKIVKIQLELTPDELTNRDVKALIENLTSSVDVAILESQVAAPPNALDHGLEPALARWVDDIAGSNLENRSLVKEFLREALDSGNVSVDHGKSRQAQLGRNEYAMLRYTGPTDRGALAYLFPGGPRVEFRLPPDVAGSYDHARILPREASGERYMIAVDLTSLDAVAQAIDLIPEAINRLQTWNG